MTVSITTRKASFNGSGTTGPFTFSFRFFENSEISIIHTDALGADTNLLETTHYTLTGATSYQGGSVTLVTGLETGERITVVRTLPLTQEIDLRNQGAFFAETIEEGFDRVTMLIQQMGEILSRVPTFPVTATVEGIVVPTPESLLHLRWNLAATNLENAPASTSGGGGPSSVDPFAAMYF